jgi:hypothetical protein
MNTTTDLPRVSFSPKRSRYGDVRWTGFYTHGTKASGTTYVMLETAGPANNRWVRADSRDVVEVVQTRGGWNVVVDGATVVATERLKTDAQRVAESLLVADVVDGPCPNCGRDYEGCECSAAEGGIGRDSFR